MRTIREWWADRRADKTDPIERMFKQQPPLIRGDASKSKTREVPTRPMGGTAGQSPTYHAGFTP